MAASKNEQRIEISAGDVDLAFCVNRDNYNKYINAVHAKDKVAPSHNFLMATVEDDCKESLREFLRDTPSGEVQIASFVLEQYTPDINLVVKKSSSVQSS